MKFFLLFLSLLFCISCVPHNSNYDMLVRYHGGRIHIKVLPASEELHPRIISACLCTSVDLNMEDAGCNTPGFVVKELIEKGHPISIKGDALDVRSHSTSNGLSFKPVQVIDKWPLVYVELEVRLKIPGGGWAANGTTTKKTIRVDKYDTKSGRALGMEIDEDDELTWQAYTGMVLLGAVGVFLVMGLIQRKIKSAKKIARGQRLYSDKAEYKFQDEKEDSKCNFLNLYKSETLKDQRERTDIEEQRSAELIAINAGILLTDDMEGWQY